MTTFVITNACSVTGKLKGSEWNARSTCKERLKLARTGQPSSLDLSFRLLRWEKYRAVLLCPFSLSDRPSHPRSTDFSNCTLAAFCDFSRPFLQSVNKITL